MAVEYTGKNVLTYKQEDYRVIKNGTTNTSELMIRTTNNQTWLAVQDVPACNFLNSASGAVWNSVDGRCLVRVPPFVTHVEMWFLCKRDDVTSATQLPYVEIESTNTGLISRNNLVLGGSDSTGKGGIENELTAAMWLMFSGIAVESGSIAPRALKVRSSTDMNTWIEDTIKFRTSTDMLLYTGFWRAIPTDGPLISQT